MILRDLWWYLTTTPSTRKLLQQQAGRAVNSTVDPATADTPPPALTVDELAFQLLAEYPGGIDSETLWRRCSAAGLPMIDVDRTLDHLREVLRQEARAEVKIIDTESLRVLDLTEIESVRMRVKGVAYYVTDAERKTFGALEYLLVREPENEHDANAIAVYGHARKVGHVAASRAAMIAPLLDRLTADAFKVTGTPTQPHSSSLWIDVPKVTGLRNLVRLQGRDPSPT